MSENTVSNKLIMEIYEKKKIEKFMVSIDSVLVMSLTEGGEFSKISKSFCDLLGHSEEELLGTCFKDYLHPNDNISWGLYTGDTSLPENTKIYINQYKTKSKGFVKIAWAVDSSTVIDGHWYSVAITASLLENIYEVDCNE